MLSNNSNIPTFFNKSLFINVLSVFFCWNLLEKEFQQVYFFFSDSKLRFYDCFC